MAAVWGDMRASLGGAPWREHRRWFAAVAVVVVGTTALVPHRLVPRTAELAILAALFVVALVGRTLAVPAGVVVSVVLVVLGVMPVTGQMGVVAVLVVVSVVGRDPGFAWRWLPWLAAAVLLDDLEGLQVLGPTPHGADVAALERGWFGAPLPVLLQHHLDPAGSLTPLGVVVGLLYNIHSPAPLVAAAVIWRHRPHLFMPFVASILLVDALGAVLYILVPESPPWLLAQHGLIDPVRRIPGEVFGLTGHAFNVYDGADPFPSAAMPSLHVSLPLIVAWWTVSAFGARAAWIFLYPLALSIGVVYLGEHWLIDSIVGVAAAAVAIAIVEGVRRRHPAAARRWLLAVSGRRHDLARP